MPVVVDRLAPEPDAAAVTRDLGGHPTGNVIREIIRIAPPVRWIGIPDDLAILSNDVRGITVVVTAGTIYYVAITRRLTTWLSGPAIQFLGKISYSLYLIHLAAGIFIVNLAWKYVPHAPTNALLLVPVGMASAIIVGSMLIFTLCERPSVSVSQRMKKNRPPGLPGNAGRAHLTLAVRHAHANDGKTAPLRASFSPACPL